MQDYNLTKIKQYFRNNSLVNLRAEIRKELHEFQNLIKPETKIAIAVGSRGIRNLDLVVKEVAGFIRENNAQPFIIPAMGSHGGASAGGQAGILGSYGISEKATGIPVRSSMEVVEVPGGDQQYPVYMDKIAFESEGIILINRIKPHTDFHGKYESGLVKMAVIGLGKEKQASAIHSYGVYGLSVLIPLIAKQVFSTGRILGGVALVENAYDETMMVKALRSDDILEKEPALLEIARENMPELPAREIDVLIIDQMGKEISGAGIDTNIIGRIKITGQAEPETPVIKAIVVLDLTDKSCGNAIGVGLSDVISRRLYNKIDFSSTYTNVITSSFLERAKIPLVAENDRQAFEIALRSCGYLKKGSAKIIRIRDTLNLDEMYVSKPVLDSLKAVEIEIIKKNVNLFNRLNEVNPF